MSTMTPTPTSLLSLSRAQLDALYRASPAGQIPVGEGAGKLLPGSGPWSSRMAAKIIEWLFWKGKTFDSARGMLWNRISALGFRAIPARVYKGTSVVDGRECIVLDYSTTSVVARPVRDEIREVAPGVYLGVAYVRTRRAAYFCLQFR